jgi:general secretion pathway protein D
LNIKAPKTVKVNNVVRIEVLVADVKNMYNGMLAVQFDPALMDFFTAEEGGFLKQDGKPTSFQHVVNNDEGRVNLNLYRIGNIGGISGSGTLAVLTFKAKSKGVVNLRLSDAYILAPGGSKPINADLYGSAVEIQ